MRTAESEAGDVGRREGPDSPVKTENSEEPSEEIAYGDLALYNLSLVTRFINHLVAHHRDMPSKMALQRVNLLIHDITDTYPARLAPSNLTTFFETYVKRNA